MPEELYLGRVVDPATGKTSAEALRLDPSDLTTHGLIVGMTGSGKTGLGIVLIEELLRKGIPVIAVDPKGDLGNLLLDFPALSAEEFDPWVPPGTGATGASEARKWSEGLAGWGLAAADVGALRAARDATIYTPGSSAGVPLDLFGALTPGAATDEEGRRDVVGAFLTGLLGLVGIDADPVTSRELILLSQCVDALFAEGKTASLEALLPMAAQPPFGTVGALPLETFYPAKERQQLVLKLNALLASPSAAAFRTGAPLDVDAMLGAGAKPRLSIVSIAALSDSERIFVMATLLSRVLAWTRRQSGSTTLRAAIYVDEIFGFFPPSGEPPTKRPLLTLLKQARAFGVGVVLATQNPVDLDYKGLANCGCWWVGTLQTERDRERLADGLTSASGSREAVDLLAKARKRVFLLHDVHRKAPALVETRWAMSYLRGPMTREEIAKAKGLAVAPAAAASVKPAAAAAADAAAPAAPSPWKSTWVKKRGADIATPHLFVKYAVRYKVGTKTSPETTGVRLFPLDAASAGEVLEAEAVEVAADALLAEALPGLRYGAFPAWLGAAAVKQVEKAVKDRLPDKLAVTLLKDPLSGALSQPGEDADAFASRLAASAGSPALREKLEKKKRDLALAESQEKTRSMETMGAMAGAAIDVLGGLFGKRKSLRVGKVGGVLSKKRLEDAAEGRIEALRAEIAELEEKLAPTDTSRFESVEVVPAKTGVDLLSIGIAWVA